MADAPRRKPLPLAECGVLISGGTSGVGLATAIAFAQAGVVRIGLNGRKVSVAKRRGGPSLSMHQAPKSSSSRAIATTTDQAREVCEAAREKLGSVDVLVNSTVGQYSPKLFHKIALEDIRKIVASQMLAPLLTSSLVVPWMRERGGGAIINIASDAGKVATPGETVIGAAMAGIIMFTRALAIEGKRDGIRANVLTPSIIEGTGNYAQVMADEFSSKLFGKAIKMAQLGVVQPDDFAALIVFLATHRPRSLPVRRSA